MRGHRRWTLLAVVVAMAAALVAAIAVAPGGDEAAGPDGRTTTSSAVTTDPVTTGAPSSSATTATSAPTTTATSTTEQPSTAPAVAVSRGPTDRRVVALTFDAGSDVGRAEAILDVLAANGVPASFGLTGLWTRDNPALVARMAAEGHQLLNHTWSHPSFTGFSTDGVALPTDERLEELRRAEDAILAAAGTGARPWFRPPYGDLDDSVLADVGSVGYRYAAMWTVDSLGWKGIPAAEVVDRCLDRAEPGAIYLFHVGSASTDHAALQPVLDGLRAAGYSFATLEDLIGA